MPTAQTQIRTDRASRYLVQLCEHLNRIDGQRGHRAGHGAGRGVQRVEWTGDHGRIVFAFGHCELHATDDRLTLELTADDAEALRHMQDMFRARLETIGRRDRLTVTW